MRNILKNRNKFKIERIYRRQFERRISELFDRILTAILGHEKSFTVLSYIFRLRTKLSSTLRFNEFGPGLWLDLENLKSHYYEIIYVDPASIKYVVKDGRVPFVQAGDWDLRKKPFELHPSIVEIYEEKKPFRDTQQYSYMLQRISDGLPAYWCKTEKDVDKYFEILINAFEEIKRGEYKVQPINSHNVYPDEILVSVSRDGSFMHERNGSHRLSAAKYFGLRRVPVVVIRWHAESFRNKRVKFFVHAGS